MRGGTTYAEWVTRPRLCATVRKTPNGPTSIGRRLPICTSRGSSWTSRNPGARAVLPDRGHRSIVPSFRRLREQTRANALTTRTIRFPLGGDIPDLTADARKRSRTRDQPLHRWLAGRGSRASQGCRPRAGSHSSSRSPGQPAIGTSGYPYGVWLVASLCLLASGIAARHYLIERQSGGPPRVRTLLLLAVVLAALALPAIPTGDEPHFLIMTQSLLRDGDLDLRDNYARGDYLEYHPQPIGDPHVVEIRGTWQPVHGIGLPILSLAWFAIAGRPAVVLMLTIMTAAAIGLTWSLLARLGFDRRSTNLAVLAGGLTLPLVSLSGQVFAEIPAVLLVALGLWAALDLRAGMSTLALLVTLVLLPWLHPKFIAVAIALLVSTAILQRDRASLPLSLALFALATSVLGLVAFSYATYGSALPGGAIVVALSPRAEDWVGPMIGHFLAAPQVGLVGILFDQQSGLLIANPIYLLLSLGWSCYGGGTSGWPSPLGWCS